jgi:mannose-6-phosphate isomerase
MSQAMSGEQPGGAASAPLRLPANFVPRFYRGGSRLGPFRRIATGPYDGEDWVGSTTQALGAPEGLGPSRLADGRLLAEAVAADPEGFLGPDHVAAFGTSTELLVKLLDPDERLAVHYHPDQEFARTHLGCAHGKTEAWVVLDAPADGAVHLGFREEVSAEALAALSQAQDSTAMLAALNRVPVQAGDAILVPAGVPHAVGAGVFAVELQEPTDWSLMLEHAGLDLGEGGEWHLGLGPEVALAAVDRSGWTPERLAELRLPAPLPLAPGVARLLPERADPFFRAESVSAGALLAAAFSVLVCVEGELALVDEAGGRTVMTAGESVLLPYRYGRCALEGSGRAVRCLPPPTDSAVVTGAR